MDASQAAPPERRTAAPTAPAPPAAGWTPMQWTAATLATAGPAVRLLSPDPDFRDLLAFLFRYHGFTVTVDTASVARPPAPDGAPPALLVLDLTDAAAAALLAPAGPPGLTLVLTRPETAALAQQLVPAASGWLSVPVPPLALVAVARQLLGGPPRPR